MDSPADARRTLFLWFSVILCLFVAFSATIGVKFCEGDRVKWGCYGFELVPKADNPAGKETANEATVEHEAVHSSAGDGVQSCPGNPPGHGESSSCSTQACTLDYKAFFMFFTMHFFRSLFYLGAVDLQIASIANSTVSRIMRFVCNRHLSNCQYYRALRN